MQHKALGRGLDALLKPGAAAPQAAASGETVARISVDAIRPNRSQPRSHFAAEALAELADSIRTHGIAQPLIVCPADADGLYELIAGERRWRAAKMAGLAEVPCLVRRVTDRGRAELSLIENIQRENLNAIEEAEAIRRLIAEFGLTQEEVSRALGRSRPAVANKLRLLDLPEDIRASVREGAISEGHARALLAVEEDERRAELGRRIVDEKLTVRDVEKIVASWQSATEEGRVTLAPRKAPEVRAIEDELQNVLSRRVEVDAKGAKGWLKLAFYSADDLQVLIDQLKKK